MLAGPIDEPLIDAIYNDAVQKGDWTPAMVRLRTLLRAKETTISAVTFDRRLVKWSGGIVATTGCVMNGEANHRYSAHYMSIDPKAPIFSSQPVGFVFNDAGHFDNSFVARDCFYQEYSRTLGLRHGLNRLILRDRGRELYLAAMRSGRQGPFDCAAEEMLVWASRHFLRAWQLRKMVSEAQTAMATAVAALDHLDYGILVLDDGGRIRLVNEFARNAMARGEGLRVTQGRLIAGTGVVQRALDAALSSATKSVGAAQALRIPRGQNRCWFVWCMPLAPENPLAANDQPGILIIIRDPLARSTISDHDLMILYQLTQSEAEVARALAEGMTLNVIAEKRGVKFSTVHTQLKRILQKTGLHRQSDLVRTIVALSALHQPKSYRNPL